MRGRYIDDLETFIKAPSFKHKDFWERELGDSGNMERC